MKRFWIDADVFIQSENGLYSLDMAPPFWSFIDEQAEAGRVRSSIKIYKEIIAKEDPKDALVKWIKTRKNTALFVDPAKHKSVQDKCGEICNYVATQYASNPAKVAAFLSGGDTWIIAHAACDNGVVVSHEHRVDRTSQTPKIPNVCTRFGIECINLREMLRRLNFKFNK